MGDFCATIVIGLILSLAVGPQSSQEHASQASWPASLKTFDPDGTNFALFAARLSRPLKATKAKPGERVTAEVLSQVELPDGSVIPRHSLLIGHVTEAQKRGKGQESVLGFKFDSVRRKGSGRIVPFTGKIRFLEQYTTAYEDYRNSLRRPCLQTETGPNGYQECRELGDLLPPLDFSGLDKVKQQSDEAQGVVLSSMRHNVKIGDVRIWLLIR